MGRVAQADKNAQRNRNHRGQQKTAHHRDQAGADLIKEGRSPGVIPVDRLPLRLLLQPRGDVFFLAFVKRRFLGSRRLMLIHQRTGLLPDIGWPRKLPQRGIDTLGRQLPEQQEGGNAHHRPDQLSQQCLPLLTGHLAGGQGAVGFHPGRECQGHHDCFSSGERALKARHPLSGQSGISSGIR